MFFRLLLVLSVVALESLTLNAVPLNSGNESKEAEILSALSRDKNQLSSQSDDPLETDQAIALQLENGSDDLESILRKRGRGKGKIGEKIKIAVAVSPF